MYSLSGMFNIVSTCSYGMTPDKVKQYEIWERKEKELTKNSEQKVRHRPCCHNGYAGLN